MSYTNYTLNLKDTIDRFYLLTNAEKVATNAFTRKGEALAADQQQPACNSYTNVSCSSVLNDTTIY